MTNPLALPGSKYLQLSQPNPCITTCQVKPWMAETWSSQILLFYLQMGQIENTDTYPIDGLRCGELSAR